MARVRSLPPVAAANGARDEHGFDFVFAHDLAKPMATKEFLVRHFGFAKGRVSLVTGYSGVGKTIAVQALALAVACEEVEQWCGLAVERRGRVLHFDFEMGQEDLRRRYQRLAHAAGVELAAIGDRLGLVSMPNVKLSDPDAEARFLAACAGVTLAVVDNLAAASPSADENSRYMRDLIDKLSRVSMTTGCVFLLLHHENKPTRDRHSADLVRARGTSAIMDAVGNACSIYAHKGRLFVGHTKADGGGKSDAVCISVEDSGDEVLGRDAPGLIVRRVVEEGSETAPDDPAEFDPAIDRFKASLREVVARGPISRGELLGSTKGRLLTKKRALAGLVFDGEVSVEVGPRGAKVYSLRAAYSEKR